MEEQDITLPVRLNDAVPVGGALNDTTKSFFLSGPFRLEVAVGVIDMEYGKSLLRRSISCSKGSEDTYSCDE